jgi:hypothetical protein
MGTLAGHLLPGSFFIAFAIWWSFVTNLRYIKSTLNNQKSKGYRYRSSVAMPCICCPGRLKKLPIESMLKLLFALVGLIGEVVTGLKFHEKPLIVTTGISMATQAPAHQHVHERDIQPGQIMVRTWHFESSNLQHSTMYAAFILSGIVEILMHAKFELPKRTEYVFNLIGFFVEFLLFKFHLHGRNEIDILMHTLLLYAIAGCIVSGVLECCKPENVIFAYGRILFTMLQGTWFFEAGFVLYPPWDFITGIWDPNSHEHIMVLTATFLWHILLIMATMLVQLLVMRRFYASKALLMDDLEAAGADECCQYRALLTGNNLEMDMETKLVNESDESEIEFESMKPKQSSTNSSTSSDRKR